MLPPVAPAVLENNPRFKALYSNLASSRLNGDASTRLIKQQRAQADIEKQLTIARKEDAQSQLLQDALRSIALGAADLPLELIETCHLISAQLNGDLSSSDLGILADDIDYFLSNISLVATAVSNHLEESALLIAKLATPNGDPPDITEIPVHAASLHESIANQTTSIALARSRVTELGDQIHHAYRELFETSIRILEQTIHGSVARGMKSRAEHLAVVAKGMELKLQVLAQTDTFLTDPSLQSDLVAYNARLKAMETDLGIRWKKGEMVLAEYEKAGRGMGEIAKRYAQLTRECDAVKGEIAKLESRSSDVD